MDFRLTEEQQMIVDTTRDFVTNELFPHEAEVEETGVLRPELRDDLKRKAIAAGLLAANMPAEVGGAELDTLTWILYERELGKANYALHWTCVARPSNILVACRGEQRERYLLPAVRGERADCLAMTEPGAGSDLRGMTTSAVASGDDFIINGTKHFISHADEADFVILFVASGEEETARGRKKLITAFLIDKDTPGFVVRPGYKNVELCRILGDGDLTRARTVAEKLAAGPPLAFAAIKEVVRATSHLPVQQAFDLVTSRKLPTVDRLYSSEDQLEGAGLRRKAFAGLEGAIAENRLASCFQGAIA